MNTIALLSSWTEGDLRAWLEHFRSFGPLPGILLTFMKSFVPPLPTMVIIGLNAAVYGLWQGFLYSWIGIVSGCLTTFMLVRKASNLRYVQRWRQKPKVQKALHWARRNAFSYVFVLSLFPMGPFVAVNVAAAVSGMTVRSYLAALLPGKAIMIFYVSYIGYDLERFARRPWEIVFIVLFVALAWWISRKVEAHFTKMGQLDESGESSN
ncbi:hypothetical protein A7K91_02225 [Paenibacillus oryzae]|uniref:TVP38/TMEM64 family membrane protein n=1 Tax=Paenibacillus oryzae TaxID=1844972 RepID=A0A1A5YA57_9BACL|nr:TVP38/TMEM64 family protein [Paenibacillus oryzae]OBR62453.1 hypothetical protein A7K91_02225 [Paenibacillus oryzae]